MQVLEPGKGEGGELKVVGGEEGVAPPLVQGLGEGGGDGHPVQAARAPAHLVQEDEATFGGLLEHQGHLLHLHHEGALPPGEVVRGPDPRVDPVKRGSSASSAGTKLPIWARRAMRAVWRRKVDFPAMLGPVTRTSSWAISRSLGTKAVRRSTTGWRPALIRSLSPKRGRV